MIFALAKRNLLVFFKDKTAVFFSLLSVFIIIGLYILFLGDTMTQNYKDFDEHARYLMDAWIMAGVIGVSTTTTIMGAFGIKVQDDTRKITKDFKASPLKRESILLGYILSSIIIGFIMCLIALILSQVYIIMYGGQLMSLLNYAKTIGIILIVLISHSAIILYMITFFKTNSAFASASTIIGTLIGFIAGIYVPVGVLPELVQNIIVLFPPYHVALLLRQTMMEKPFTLIQTLLNNNPEVNLNNLKVFLGVEANLYNFKITPIISISYLLFITLVFYALAMMKILKKTKE